MLQNNNLIFPYNNVKEYTEKEINQKYQENTMKII